MRTFIAGSLGCVLLTLSFAASAQQWQGGFNTNTGAYGQPLPSRSTNIENIGNQGQWVFGAERITSVAYDKVTTEPDVSNSTETTNSGVNVNLFAVQPTRVSAVPRLALDYLVTDGVTVGGSLGLMLGSDTAEVGSSEQESSRFGFLFSPRVGYAYAFDETFGIWPRAAFNFFHSSTTTEGVANGGDLETKGSVFGFTAEAMGVLSPFKHVAFLGGPYVDYLVGTSTSEVGGVSGPDSDTKLLSIGLSFAVSAYY